MCKIKFVIIVSILLSCLSCKQNVVDDIKTSNNPTVSKDSTASVDPAGSNCTDCTISGILRYNSELNRWEIRKGYPNTIDSVDIYVVSGYEVTYPKDVQAKVQATGCCQAGEQIGVPAGTTMYYIYVKDLIEE